MSAIPFPQGGHLLGQPVTVNEISVPINATLTCNCLAAGGNGGTVLSVVASAPVTCPNCRKVYTVSFHVAGNLMVATSDPVKEPS